jgi:hypothetical protein
MHADRHPADDRLLAAHFDRALADAATEQHVSSCPPCAERRRALVDLLDADRAQVRHQAESWFTATRLGEQRDAILARLAEPRRARVLPFRGAPASDSPFLGAAPYRRRLVAAAAVLAMLGAASAGFVIREERQALVARATEPRFTAPVATVHSAVGPVDEMLLSEIDVALASPRADELRVLDALTPHALDLGDR